MRTETLAARPDDELLTLGNVVHSPHSLRWTEDFTRDVASAIASILAVAAGECPAGANANVLNPEVFATAAFAAKRG